MFVLEDKFYDIIKGLSTLKLIIDVTYLCKIKIVCHSTFPIMIHLSINCIILI